MVIGAEDQQDPVRANQRDAHREQDLHEVRLTMDRPQQGEIDAVPEREQHDSRHDEQCVWSDPRAGEEHIRDVHAQHHESAVGEVYDAHHSEDQRQAHAHKRVERAGQQAVDHCLEGCGEVHDHKSSTTEDTESNGGTSVVVVLSQH